MLLRPIETIGRAHTTTKSALGVRTGPESPSVDGYSDWSGTRSVMRPSRGAASI